ncbi:hypothetical protein Z517_00529 [Fonsecaea pedrosoi CBS 271.37]|uniref:Uncharacterized protein n=1 Tax=Fonsecaea pedrosoi CBS 271.37 TaxID=1442368 RepID=A0A0D2H2S6_9EURO|nr:uncharacterized protein Z517_00529 [Fonsecaea pedrosoi CBS 271.37]KIW85140.1 hypothetical protein Z517_00529 [Fonsecaea pedrosoi CBS 271.37]
MAPSTGAGSPASKAKPTTAAAASDADIATNKALLFHAEAARLAKSWLRGTAVGDGPDKDEDEDKAEEDLEREFLRNKDVYSETGGVGYHPPTESSLSNGISSDHNTTTAFLRKQLLRGHQRGRATNGSAQTHNASTARPNTQLRAPRQAKGEDDSDEEESRSGVVGKRKRNTNAGRAAAAVESEASGSTPSQIHPSSASETRHSLEPSDAADSAPNESHDQFDSAPQATSSSNPQVTLPRAGKKRGASSYLDELLASRAAKKNKKKKKGVAESEPG